MDPLTHAQYTGEATALQRTFSIFPFPPPTSHCQYLYEHCSAPHVEEAALICCSLFLHFCISTNHTDDAASYPIIVSRHLCFSVPGHVRIFVTSVNGCILVFSCPLCHGTSDSQDVRARFLDGFPVISIDHSLLTRVAVLSLITNCSVRATCVSPRVRRSVWSLSEWLV